MRVVACELPDEVLVATMYTSQILMGCVPARTMHSQSDIYQQRIYTELTNSVQAYGDTQRFVYSLYGVA